jgi:hypothetical protein
MFYDWHMTNVVSILTVASYYFIMYILVMSICIEPGRWESHITILECSWARSVRKLYDYSRVLLWIMSLTYGHDYTGTHRTLLKEGCDVKVDMHCICTFEVHLYWSFMLAWSGYEEHSFHLYEEYSFHYKRSILFIYMRSIVFFIFGYRLLLYIMVITCLWKFHWINILIMNLYLFWHVFLLWLNHCLIKL